MELKDGFKNTVYGVIPKDWVLCSVQELIDNKSLLGHLDGNHGAMYPRSEEFVDFGVPYIGATDFTDGYISFKNCKYLSEERSNQFRKGVAQNGDVLFAHNATVGPVALLTTDLKFVILSTTATYYRCNKEKLHNIFLMYALQSPYFVQQYKSVMAQSTRFQVPITTQRKLFLVITPLPEQHAIAEALSDMDALIASQEALIAKKRAIKQGVMQELLTGKRCLPGFRGEWKVKRLGDIADIKTGEKNNDDKIADGEFPFFVRSQTIERINTFSFNGEAILVPGEGNIGRIFHYINGKFDYHQRVYKISDFLPNVYGKYIYFVMCQMFNEHAMRNSVKATVDSLRLPTFQKFELQIPDDVKEQEKIAEILTESDQEIFVLEQKLEKTKAIKQGMMQELLTGHIRLM